ncbi:MAG: sensor histidine kinase [Candidatus Omnitrophica bacterium]|nr:sensor histidine kinase [Candidatus Omnitrophota bacterium]
MMQKISWKRYFVFQRINRSFPVAFFLLLLYCPFAYSFSDALPESKFQNQNDAVWRQSTVFNVAASCGLVILCFMIGIFANRHLALEHLVDEKTVELKESYGKNIRYETEMKAIASELCSSEERIQRRIGQDLHNDLVQDMTGIGMLMQSLQNRLSARSLPEAIEIKRLIRMLSETVEKTRDLAKILSPLSLESHGLIFALQELIVEIRSLYGVSCHFDYDLDAPDFDPEAANHLYRIAQEAMVNAGRHAEADHIWISLKKAGEGFVLSVQDDGVGMPQDVQKANGLGLRSIRYRCSLINARLDIDSQPDRGTKIVCQLM